MADNSIKERTITGAFWEGIHNGGATLLAFVSTIVLARLLTPEDYGYVGMLAIFIAVAESLVNGGFGSALIQKKKPTEADYSTVFFLNIGVSLFLYVVLFLSAPAISRYYHLPLLSKVLRVQGLIIIINAFKLVQDNVLRKRLQFKTIALVEVIIATIALALVIYLAWKGFGVWALVIWRLFIGVATTVAYWVVGNWRPKMIFSMNSLKELFSFGGFMLLSSMVNQIYANVQGLLIGRKYPPDIMGYYSKAQNAESLSSSLLSKIGNNVSYPVLAEFQDNRDAMINVLRKIIKVVFFVTIPLMMLLLLEAKPIFLLLYSERWVASVPYFKILCFMGIFACVEGVGNNAIAALGKGKTFFWQNLIKKVVGIVIIISGMAIYGMTGLLIGMVIASLFNYIVNMFLIDRHVGYSTKCQIVDVLPMVFLTFISFGAGWLLGLMNFLSTYLLATIQTIAFLFIYISGSYLLKLDAFLFTKDMLRMFVNKFRKVRL